MMPPCKQEYRWLALSCTNHGFHWKWEKDHLISFECFGHCVNYSAAWGKYAPDEEPGWHPFRDAWKNVRKKMSTRTDELIGDWTAKTGPTGRAYMEGPNGQLTKNETLRRSTEAAAAAAAASVERDLREAAARGEEILRGETNLPRRREAIEHTRRERAKRAKRC